MLRQTHIATSELIISLPILLTHASLKTGAMLMIGTYLGAQLPDIDHPKSAINKITGPVGKFFAAFGHRTLTHCLLAWLFLLGFYPFMPTIYHLNLFYAGILIGYLLHLIEDNFSRQGILWCYPLSHYQVANNGHLYKKRPYKNYYYTTGGRGETVIYILSLLADLLIIYCLFKNWF